MFKQLFDPKDIPADLRECFEEVEVQCGAPWARVVEREATESRQSGNGWQEGRAAIGHHGPSRPGSFLGGKSETTGWRPTCACDAGEPIPCRVLDPFGGSGRTALAAEELGRDCTLIELNPASVRMARAQLERAKARRYIGDDVTRESADPRQGALL